MYLERIAEDPHEILSYEGRIPACGENKDLPYCGVAGDSLKAV